MIALREVSKWYGNTCALDDVTLEVESGQVVLLLGSNGAGKSTLVRIILGIIPFSGDVRVDGHDPLVDGREVRSRIGYMPQSAGLHDDMTVGETMEFYASLRAAPSSRIRELLELVELDDVIDLQVAELSGGMRQRLGFAVALLGDPPILLLDEPTASLDTLSRDLMARTIRALADAGKTIVMSTHADQRLIEEADRTIVLDDGRLVAVPTREKVQ